ncbi:MAG: hypothetical protein ABSG53_15520 [Thermoguttaceae bacterium]|jgi:hypothetical protein
MLRLLTLIGCLLSSGCAMLPEIVHQPTLHNPFPQISKVAIVPFFNLSSEATLDGRKVAEAYAAELAEVPGYVVIPVCQVDTAIHAYGLRLDQDKDQDARRLAQILQVDAVVVGAVTEYTPYYPPRLTLQVAWFTANPNYHPIPAGYGLPWGTTGEKDIPGPLVFQAELELAKEQLKTQTPPYQKQLLTPPTSNGPSGSSVPNSSPVDPGQTLKGSAATGSKHDVRTVSHEEADATTLAKPPATDVPTAPATLTSGENNPDVPPNWPDPRGFIPRPPTAHPAPGVPSDEPVMQHMKSYRGNDVEFTTALEDYYYSRDDARMGGWQNYLRRSDDFIRFCCHLHIWEMLSARGGAGETRVVWRWSPIR